MEFNTTLCIHAPQETYFERSSARVISWSTNYLAQSQKLANDEYHKTSKVKMQVTRQKDVGISENFKMIEFF